MFIAWSGRGLFAMLILMLSASLPAFGVAMFGEFFPDRNLIQYFLPCLGAGLFIGGVLCWRFGRRWNRHSAEGAEHTLYGLPVEIWGALAIVSAFVLIGNFAYSLAQNESPAKTRPSENGSMRPAGSL